MQDLHIQRMTWEGNLKKQKLSKSRKSAYYWEDWSKDPCLWVLMKCLVYVSPVLCVFYLLCAINIMEHIFVMILNTFYIVCPAILSFFKNFFLIIIFFLLELDIKTKTKKKTRKWRYTQWFGNIIRKDWSCSSCQLPCCWWVLKKQMWWDQKWILSLFIASASKKTPAPELPSLLAKSTFFSFFPFSFSLLRAMVTVVNF